MTDIRLTNYNMASARLIGGVVFAIPLAAVFVYFVMNLSARSFSSNPEELLLVVVAPLSAVGFAWMAMTAVTSLTIGDQVLVGTAFGSKKYPLADIDQIEFGTEITRVQGVIPVAQHLMMHVYLSPGRHVQVKVSQSQAQEVVSALGAQGMNRSSRRGLPDSGAELG